MSDLKVGEFNRKLYPIHAVQYDGTFENAKLIQNWCGNSDEIYLNYQTKKLFHNEPGYDYSREIKKDDWILKDEGMIQVRTNGYFFEFYEEAKSNGS